MTAAPSYICNLIASSHPMAPDTIYDQPMNSCLAPVYRTLGDRSVTMAAPRLRNSLPPHIKNARTVDSFKSLLKIHLFKLAFGN